MAAFLVQIISSFVVPRTDEKVPSHIYDGLDQNILPNHCILSGYLTDFAGHVIVTTGLRRMHFPRPGIFLRWNSNLQQVDFSQGFASNNILGIFILGLVVLAVNDGFLH